MRVSLDWLKDFVDIKSDIDKIQHRLTMTGLEIVSTSSIEGDKVMEIEVTPNRPDCLSMLGIAREISAAIDKPIKLPSSVKSNLKKRGHGSGAAKVIILDKRACTRYVGCVIKNIKVGPSPNWLVKRLNSLGVRSINNVVDITNYVLFELGQPLHVFDLDKLDGKTIIVRRSKKTESIVTIDGITRQLNPNMLIIADAKKPVAIAGIMGGKDTEISMDTKNILLESAYFDASMVRKAERHLSLASESSYRFERGVDFDMVYAASIRAQELIKEVSGAKTVGQITDISIKRKKEKKLFLSLDEIPRILGVEINPADAKDIFKRLNFQPIKKKNKIYVTVPSYRRDIDSEIDLIEEISRLYGYDKIPARMPVFSAGKIYMLEKKTRHLENKIRQVLCALGLNEIVTYALTSKSSIEALSMIGEDLVQLKNPLSSEQEYMRPSILPEMLETLNWNLNRRNEIVQLFELNKVYKLDKKIGKTHEELRLCIGLCGMTHAGWKDKSRDLDFFDLKGIIETLLDSLGVKNYHIERMAIPFFIDALSVGININGKGYGYIGELRPEIARKFDIKKRVFLSEIAIESLSEVINLKKVFMPLARYPSVTRDISLLVDDNISALDISSVIREEANQLVKSINVFDLYRGQQIQEGKKSIAYTIEYRSDERTLKDEEVNEIHKNVQSALIKRLRADIR